MAPNYVRRKKPHVIRLLRLLCRCPGPLEDLKMWGISINVMGGIICPHPNWNKVTLKNMGEGGDRPPVPTALNCHNAGADNDLNSFLSSSSLKFSCF